ncbi:MAG: DEAD/DEAH box helicase [Cyanobacteria bacterium P01_F01_bin.53]
MSLSATSQQQALLKTYQRLTDTHRSIVQVFALLHEPKSHANALQVWNRAIADPNDAIEPLTRGGFLGLVTELIQHDLLMQQWSQGVRCNPAMLELVMRDVASTERFEQIAQAIAHHFPIQERYSGGPLDFLTEAEFTRELRIAIYRQDRREVDGLFADLRHANWHTTLTFASVFQEILTNPFDIDWFNRLSKEFFELGLSLVLEDSVKRCVPAEEAFEILEDAYQDHQLNAGLCVLYAEQLWLRARLQEASEVLAGVSVEKPLRGKYCALLGAIAFLAGHTKDALAHYQQALKATGKSQSAQATWFQSPAAAVFFFVLLKTGSATALAETEKYIGLLQKQTDHWLKGSMRPLASVLHGQQGKLRQVAGAAAYFKNHTLSDVGLPALLEIYSLYWLDVDNLDQWVSAELPQLCQRTLQAGYDWIALETADLLSCYQSQNPFVQMATEVRQQSGSLPLITVVERKAAWELSLNALSNLMGAKPNSQDSSEEPTFRLAWRLRFISSTFWSLAPLEQKLSVKGGWTKGKPVALKRLATESIAYLTDQDRELCDTLEVEYEDNYYHHASKPKYSFTTKSLLALVGHPLVFWSDAPDVRVDVIAGEPELLVKRLEPSKTGQQGDYLRIELFPPLENHDILAVKETPTRLKVIPVSEQHRQIAEILGAKNRLEVPAAAEERVLDAITVVANLVTVQSDIGGSTGTEEVLANAIPYVHLVPAGIAQAGLKVSLRARPFKEGGSYYRLGQGGTTVIADIGGKRLQTQRDLSAEEDSVRQIIAACPILQDYESEAGEWLIEEPSDCLDLILQLQALGDRICVEWPEGEKFKVSRQLSSSDFKVNIHRKKDWFEASGEVQVSENQVVDLQEFMTLMGNATGQFVPLADGEFLALTEEFRNRLKALQHISASKGKEIKIHGLASLAVHEMLKNLEQLKVDSAWKANIKRIQTARRIKPKVPKALKATLRDYQREGYTWLSQLAHWGVGACLADDMGLGKTLQGLAVILSRADGGPTLVVAPTSVCLNWGSEAERFAPSLQVKTFGSDNRQQLVDSVGAHDLLVCSYGLLQQPEVAKMLAAVTWQTIVLDEAQAIKNPSTKRSHAVMDLQGDFKILMTGTPIENHLGELWNLFRFINPGLLGSLESFNLRFANPIERDQDETAKDALKRLIQPFILRRTKEQVLTELPSRTDITLPIELSTDEMALYEALRREAIANLKNKEIRAGQKHLQVLAEIMRLRRVCCNPSLVKPELSMPSTKLAHFSELLEELLDNGHKALVFSQFVDHLKILRKHLDKQQISYQYLDGSTPAKKRKQSVDAFQKGKGDVFLISLKAGGTGLNLTAADYVIHMDPWWNPAVEDQASDRAYRIGQQRPVTIYRLVAKGTIEDKIVDLHKLKRDLADGLLSGSDTSGKISTEQLLSLMQA